ncbi:Glyoxalase/Bleomycin resistance protein/Dihydroxybiphenyl dioxygenase [Dactylonectria estremocensis]|uniref:Glyoxalase/Bleomycin resistance protein/Dihydroxybiphenyl dioxygenase n=1 Tax=Dactylonectria estremocensis TaxID=1079267 RepID=A0A9P9EH77_9HYPO|nr:Glyoxalase/Bleomycin resistance protein/Dihydroxybiphenyl dioxygenase [Dactylonectria estremocensis]
MTSQRPKVISPVSFAHIVLRTANFKSMVAYYKVFLGAESSYENSNSAFLTYDEEHHRIAIAEVPGTGPKARTSSGLEHIAFGFPTLGDLVEAYKQRKAWGILPMWGVNHGPTVSMYYQDPDGNIIETQVDCFETSEAANEWMKGEEFAENPLGVEFEPEDLVKRVESGEDEKEIMKRPRIGPRGLDSIPPVAEIVPTGPWIEALEE